MLAGFIGLEREAQNKPAGFRTHMLTGGAAALLVVLGPFLLKEYMRWGVPEAALRVDPLRIIEAIVVGVSFIGAGTILKVPAEDKIRFLTTAASILFSAGIGIAVAVGQYVVAAAVVVLVLVVTVILARVDRLLGRKS